MSIEKRLMSRDPCEIEASLSQSDSQAIPCVIVDISEGGAKLRLDPASNLAGDTVLVIPVIADIEDKRSVAVRWRSGDYAGVAFKTAEASEKQVDDVCR